MIYMRVSLVVGLLLLGTTLHAATIVFNTDPFEGTTALTDPGRQIVGGLGDPTAFDISVDVFAFDSAVFGISEILFANDLTSNLPSTGVNVIVVQDTGMPFLAGTAANLIADQITDPGPGFFVYFNTNLDLPRLVYSTDLSDNTADLAVLARLTNLSGPAGFAALPTFSAENFTVLQVPEPAALMLFATALVGLGVRHLRRRA